ncbi:hypothetical protein DXG01_015312 [Tephrocybe rancida]|nr:hypothetical protein DXG01_015312 [Tephrocybe rancida]
MGDTSLEFSNARVISPALRTAAALHTRANDFTSPWTTIILDLRYPNANTVMSSYAPLLAVISIVQQAPSLYQPLRPLPPAGGGPVDELRKWASDDLEINSTFTTFAATDAKYKHISPKFWVDFQDSSLPSIPAMQTNQGVVSSFLRSWTATSLCPFLVRTLLRCLTRTELDTKASVDHIETIDKVNFALRRGTLYSETRTDDIGKFSIVPQRYDTISPDDPLHTSALPVGVLNAALQHCHEPRGSNISPVFTKDAQYRSGSLERKCGLPRQCVPIVDTESACISKGLCTTDMTSTTVRWPCVPPQHTIASSYQFPGPKHDPHETLADHLDGTPREATQECQDSSQLTRTSPSRVEYGDMGTRIVPNWLTPALPCTLARSIVELLSGQALGSTSMASIT